MQNDALKRKKSDAPEPAINIERLASLNNFTTALVAANIAYCVEKFGNHRILATVAIVASAVSFFAGIAIMSMIAKIQGEIVEDKKLLKVIAFIGNSHFIFLILGFLVTSFLTLGNIWGWI